MEEDLDYLKRNFEELEPIDECGSWDEVQITTNGIDWFIYFVYSDGQVYHEFKDRNFKHVVSKACTFLLIKLEEEEYLRGWK